MLLEKKKEVIILSKCSGGVTFLRKTTKMEIIKTNLLGKLMG
jgi:hypothetical protein